MVIVLLSVGENRKTPHEHTFWGSSPISLIILSSSSQEWSQHVTALFRHVWLLLNWLFMRCQRSHPLVGFQTSTKSSLFSLVWKCVSRSSWADGVLISPRKANRFALAVLWLISCLKTYLLFLWSKEWIADVSLKVTCGLSFSSIYKRRLWRASAECWEDERRSSITFLPIQATLHKQPLS